MTSEEWRKFVTKSNRRTDWDDGAKKRLERAGMSAKYESEAKEFEFKADVAENDGKALRSKDRFEEVCSKHVLIGRPVEEDFLPAALARVMSAGAWRRAAATGGDPALLGGRARQSARITGGKLDAVPPENQWRNAEQLVEPDASFLPGRSENRCVFAQVDRDDPDPSAATEPQCGFLAKAGQVREKVPGHSSSTPASLADATVWLSAGPRRERSKPMVLVYYCRREIGPCRYPTPPDGGSHERFRPVPEDADVPFGKTLPEGVPAADHLTSELPVWEVVHENKPVPVEQVWVFGLGSIRVFYQ